LKELFQHSPGETEVDHEKLQSGGPNWVLYEIKSGSTGVRLLMIGLLN